MFIALIIVLAVVLAAAGLAALIYLAPARVVHFVIGMERRRAGLVRKEIDLPGGIKYAYLEGGRGEPLMLFHGFGANKDNFNRVARQLTRRYRVVVPDHIGFGESSHPADADYSPPAQAERLHALAQALGIGRTHLGGSSMGGHIAMTYASLYPNDVASLWLIDPAGVWSAPPSELRKILNETGRNGLMARTEDEFMDVVSFVMSDPPSFPRPVLKAVAQERIRNFDLEGRIFDALNEDSVEVRAAGIAAPTLIVWGDEDRVLHVDTAEILHRLIPNSEVIIMKGIGHLPMLERPQQSAADYLRFRSLH